MRSMCLLVCFLCACTTDDVDPTGVWNFTGKYGAGTCFPVGGQAASALTVADGPDHTYVVRAAGSMIQSAIDCNSDGCAMTAMEVASTTVTITWSLTLTSDGQITGSGSMTGMNPSCSQAIVDIMGALQ